jgi:arginyl-tRNA synthetase
LQVDTAALIKEMNELRAKLDCDVKIWRAREDAVMRKIDLTLKNIMVELDKFESIETDLLNRAKADLSKLGTNNQTKQKTIIEEISQIRQSIQLEEENRKFADAEILNAVNSYTGVLQKGLRDIVSAR